MDKKLKAKWVAALRSGKYEQTTHIYESGGKYCCLGVLVCVATGDKRRKEPTCEKWWNSLPEKKAPRYCERLIRMNDEGDSFLKIADYIETNL